MAIKKARVTVFDISRYCLNDGPGIRTTVFIKGCPLNCVWCHNPESQRACPEILYSAKDCKMCGACVDVCPNKCHISDRAHILDRTLCIGCGACADVCPTGALRLAGKGMSVDEIMKEVIKDKSFYRASGGGLTVSGGEPLMNIDFLKELLKRARDEGIHTAVETCGYAPPEFVRRIAPFVDCFLFDYKVTDRQKHVEYTGRDQALILENLQYLNEINAKIILRIPLIPAYNDTEDHVEGIRNLARKYPSIYKIQVLPYHPLGVSKERELGRPEKEPIPVPDKSMLDSFIKAIGEGLGIPTEACV